MVLQRELEFWPGLKPSAGAAVLTPRDRRTMKSIGIRAMDESRPSTGKATPSRAPRRGHESVVLLLKKLECLCFTNTTRFFHVCSRDDDSSERSTPASTQSHHIFSAVHSLVPVFFSCHIIYISYCEMRAQRSRAFFGAITSLLHLASPRDLRLPVATRCEGLARVRLAFGAAVASR